MRRLVSALGLVLLSAPGVLTLDYPDAQGQTELVDVEVPFGLTALGGTLEGNGTNASVSLVGSLLETTTDVLYLNNTNTSGTSYARLELVDSSGLGNLDLLELGVDNGTKADQITVSLGNLTSSSGSYVELAASSTNTIYVTESLAILGLESSLTVDVYVADDTAENAYVISRFNLTIT